ncbi:MAG: LysR family transcriptional regulator [Dehalococcoidia bacterium]
MPQSRRTRQAPRQAPAQVRSKVWVERRGAVVISDYLAELLAAVEARGSVASAAEALDLPYRTAWKKLREMEAAAGVKLLESESGGADGGATRLTPAATEMLSAFRRVGAGLSEELERRFRGDRRSFEA